MDGISRGACRSAVSRPGRDGCEGVRVRRDAGVDRHGLVKGGVVRVLVKHRRRVAIDPTHACLVVVVEARHQPAHGHVVRAGLAMVIGNHRWLLSKQTWPQVDPWPIFSSARRCWSIYHRCKDSRFALRARPSELDQTALRLPRPRDRLKSFNSAR